MWHEDGGAWRCTLLPILWNRQVHQQKMKSLDKRQVTGPMFRMRIRRYNKPTVILYFMTIEDVKVFNEFIKDLIANVKAKMEKPEE